MANNVASSVGGIAQKVLEFLGFHSPTKSGPGREADQWAPNFVKMFASGLESGIPQIENIVSRLAKPIAVNLSAQSPQIATPSAHYNYSSANQAILAALAYMTTAQQQQAIVVQVENIHHHYLDGRDNKDRVMTRSTKEVIKGPIR